jgi:gluconate 5-dehydrogenase
MSLFSLDGRRALITGSSQGIGFALAQALAAAGAQVILNGRNPDKLTVACQTLRGAGLQVETAAFDVTNPEAAITAVAEIEKDFGAIDILVNNAGIQRRAPLDQFTLSDWDDLMQVNLNSVFYVSRAVAPYMIARRRGKIINISSLQSEAARPSIAPYTASKGAIKNLTKGMCADWAQHGLQINAIGPGYFDTPLNKALVDDPVFDAWLRKRTPAGRWGKLEDLHGAAIFLASSASDFVNGQTIYVDGGVLAVL